MFERKKGQSRHQKRFGAWTYLLVGVGLALVAAIVVSLTRGDDFRLPLTQAKARYDAGAEAIFVDVRSAEEYSQAHIPGAVSLPLKEIESRYQELPRDAEIITYCT